VSIASSFPLARPLDMADPLAALRAIAHLPHAFALHSSRTDERSRWSFFGADPFAVFRSGDYARGRDAWRALARRVRAEGSGGANGGGRARSLADAFPTVSGGYERRLEEPASASVPFTGGAVGYWAYDFGRRLERLPARAADDLGLPDFVLAFYDVVVAYDHRAGAAWLFSSGLPHQGESRRARAEARLEDFARRLVGTRPQGKLSFTGEAQTAAQIHAPSPSPGGAVEAISTFRPEGYRRAVETVKEHIRRGDIFQANLSQRWTLRHEPVDPAAHAARLFAALCRHSPAPFAAYFGAGDHAIACASPERFLELRGDRVEARPIKGTRPRGADPVLDAWLGQELLASAKDRAENVMIVDVLRNDLGRACEFGSVRAPAVCELEAFAQVFHLTSTVTGRLRPGLDAFDLLAACFPGGSITGAPKIRAIEILDRIEPVRRHIYTGSLGYIDWRGNADWNIAIRTALVTPRATHFAAGGGVTADSDPDAEYLETLHKAEGVRAALSAVVGPVALEAGRVPV
jgi:para-aminobenzoate synthetase component 1